MSEGPLLRSADAVVGAEIEAAVGSYNLRSVVIFSVSYGEYI